MRKVFLNKLYLFYKKYPFHLIWTIFLPSTRFLSCIPCGTWCFGLQFPLRNLSLYFPFLPLRRKTMKSLTAFPAQVDAGPLTDFMYKWCNSELPARMKAIDRSKFGASKGNTASSMTSFQSRMRIHYHTGHMVSCGYTLFLGHSIGFCGGIQAHLYVSCTTDNEDRFFGINNDQRLDLPRIRPILPAFFGLYEAKGWAASL